MIYIKRLNQMAQKANFQIPGAILLAALLIAGAPGGAAYGEPQITAAAGEFSKGGAVVITGAGFGSKAVPGPLLWEDFEEGVNGVSIDQVTTKGWTVSAPEGNSVTYSDEHNRPGSTLCSKHDMQRGTLGANAARLISPTQQELDRVYLSFWVRISMGDPVPGDPDYPERQLKLWRVIDADTDSWGYRTFKSQHWIYTNGSRSAYYQMDRPSPQSLYFIAPPNPSWYRIEFQGLQSAAGVSNGSVEVWRTEQSGPMHKTIERLNFMTTEDSLRWRRFVLGEGYTSGYANGATYFDNVYLDNSWSRVLIGDASTYSACTVRENQIPSAWGDDSITVSVNPGSLGEGTAYLYVVDNNGDYNENGYSVTIGAGGECSAGYVADVIASWHTDELTRDDVNAAVYCYATGAMPTGDPMDELIEQDLGSSILLMYRR